MLTTRSRYTGMDGLEGARAMLSAGSIGLHCGSAKHRSPDLYVRAVGWSCWWQRGRLWGTTFKFEFETPSTSPPAPDARGESRSILRRRPTPRASHCRPGYPPPQTPPAGWSREAAAGATAATPFLPASHGRE